MFFSSFIVLFFLNIKYGLIKDRFLQFYSVHGCNFYCALQTEEKMRALYDRKREELKMLDEKCAEADKLEATEIYIRKLSTKISIAIQVVNTISQKISKLRDDELWPQTCELIQGYAVLFRKHVAYISL